MRKAQLSHQVTTKPGRTHIMVLATAGKSTFEVDNGYGAVRRGSRGTF